MTLRGTGRSLLQPPSWGLALGVAGLAALAAACKPAGRDGGKRSQAEALCRDKVELCEAAAARDSAGAELGAEAEARGYLFSTDDVEDIQTIVEPYQSPGGSATIEDVSSEFGDVRQYVEEFLNKALAIEPLRPGRTVTVHVLDDDAINAYADGYQNVEVNTGYLKNIDAQPFLATLCHELAHSAKNHVVKRLDFQLAAGLTADIAAFDAESKAFFEKQYDAAKGVYTHDAAGWRKVDALWQKIAPRVGAFSKRTESEADIVGAMICGHLGMSPDRFIEGYREEAQVIERIYGRSSRDDVTGAAQLKDGETFKFPSDAMFSFLFPVDSHPTDDEREAQLRRVEAIIQRHYEEGQGFFSEFVAEYQRRARGIGLGLTDATDWSALTQQHVVTATTSEGRSIRYVRPVRVGHGGR
jgi:Zn-dependent protease with chaperone function